MKEIAIALLVWLWRWAGLIAPLVCLWAGVIEAGTAGVCIAVLAYVDATSARHELREYRAGEAARRLPSLIRAARAALGKKPTGDA